MKLLELGWHCDGTVISLKNLIVISRFRKFLLQPARFF